MTGSRNDYEWLCPCKEYHPANQISHGVYEQSDSRTRRVRLMAQSAQ